MGRVPVLGLFLLLAGAARGSELEILRHRHLDAAFFTRISEYLGGPENTSGRVILRSQPDARAGYYFSLRPPGDFAPPENATWRLEVYGPMAPEPIDRSFPAAPTGPAPVYLGLTGSDWPDPEGVPAAWRVSLIDADGAVLASEASRLWRRFPPIPLPE